LNSDVQELADKLLSQQVIPWNCKHIANAEIQKSIAKISAQAGYEMPIFCTPETLMGE